MPTFNYITETVQQGQKIHTMDTDFIAGATPMTDGKGGFFLIVHILRRDPEVPSVDTAPFGGGYKQ